MPSQDAFSLDCFDPPVTKRPDGSGRAPRLARTLLRTQPDERLMELAGEGSDAAFSELVRRHQANLVAFARTIAPSGYADDVVQDAMVKARSALRRGDRPEYGKAWLFRIVRNTALNERRGWREHDRIDESIDGVEQPPQAFERRAEIRSLVIALNDLPEAQRRALVQRELEGRGHDEIAGALEVSPGAVRQLIHRARTTLRAGAGALVPATLLRAALLSGGSEQAVAGAAAAGAGLTGAKMGLGALLATGALVVGADVAVKHRGAERSDGAPAAAASTPVLPGDEAARYSGDGSAPASLRASSRESGGPPRAAARAGARPRRDEAAPAVREQRSPGGSSGGRRQAGEGHPGGARGEHPPEAAAAQPDSHPQQQQQQQKQPPPPPPQG